MATIDLLYNLGILVSICVVSGFIDHRFSKETLSGSVLQGLLFGFAAAIGMIFPYSVIDGAIFDARSVVISIGTLFFGPMSGIITVVIAILARVYVGGGAVEAGIVVILASFAVGYIFHHHLNKTGKRHTFITLYIFGLLVHIVMIVILALLLPDDVRKTFMAQFGFTVLVFYPIATVLIGKVLNDHFHGIELVESLRNNETKLSISLREKQVLLAEIHHRVKNNLAIISSLISLQAESINDDNTRGLFIETEGRIRSMSLIHELVYQNETFESVDILRYLERFNEVLSGIFDNENLQIEVRIEAANIFLDLNKAIPCALIINELLTNAYKHAFKGMQTGEVTVRFTEKQANYVLTVSDNGTGFPQGFNPAMATSFGFTIIHGLVEQLQGRIAFSKDVGTVCTVIFPKTLQ